MGDFVSFLIFATGAWMGAVDTRQVVLGQATAAPS